jgi:hypothetical protein
MQTYEAQHPITSWPELCIAVEAKFGRDLYHNAMNELLSIHQTADVQEYYNRFEAVMHKVLVHNKSLDDVFFVSKFLQGLNPDIRAAIVLHKPRTEDVALSLALMQASVLEIQPKPYFKKHTCNFNRAAGKPYPKPQPSIMGPVLVLRLVFMAYLSRSPYGLPLRGFDDHHTRASLLHSLQVARLVVDARGLPAAEVMPPPPVIGVPDGGRVSRSFVKFMITIFRHLLFIL